MSSLLLPLSVLFGNILVLYYGAIRLPRSCYFAYLCAMIVWGGGGGLDENVILLLSDIYTSKYIYTCKAHIIRRMMHRF